MGNIVLLDELTINQIAAGEVIERPASVVKEMVENSIDAGAQNITVEIKNGGISYIRITDDGKGIAKDDVEMAFERHATSKIRSAEDLQDVKSMGFRGEALASIAAIANVELITKTENDLTGTKIIVEGGNVQDIQEVGCAKGTTITVRNLFYNTPVRYKFLKRDFTETGYIEDVITRIALVHPEVAIKLINTGKTIIQTIGNGDIKTVIYSIYGKNISDEVIPVSYEYENIKIDGVIGKPAIARSNRSSQIFFVNKRYIKDKTLTSAAEQAFKGLLPIGKFGFLVLNLDMNPSKVDVNVHPAKLEVRFSEESVVFKAVYHAIKDTLEKADLISDREKNKEIKEATKDAFKIEETRNLNGGLFNRKSEEGLPKQDTETLDVLKKLQELKESLQNQIQENPKLELTQDYKDMEKKYNEIAQEADGISKKLEEKLEENKEKAQENIKIENEIEEKKIDEIASMEKFENKTNIPQNNTIIEQKENNEEENNILADIYNSRLKENQEEKEQVKDNEITENADKEDKEIVVEKTESQEVNSEEEKKPVIEKVNEKISTFEEMYKKLFGKEPIKTTSEKQEEKYRINDNDISDNLSVFDNVTEYKKKTYKFIGIAFKTYIILEMDNELYIMDQHAAHERIMYEKVKKNFYSDTEKNSQILLLPDIITLTHKEMGIAKDNFALFEKAGFMLEEFGENTIKLSGVPEVCIDLDTKELFLETLDEINTVARTAKQEKEEKFIATVACKAAVKANMALEKEEVESLMDQLLELPNPFTCPHGRPTVIKMSKYDIERKFDRK